MSNQSENLNTIVAISPYANKCAHLIVASRIKKMDPRTFPMKVIKILKIICTYR